MFSIDPNIGRIELNKSVDYEMKQQYTFLVSDINYLISFTQGVIALFDNQGLMMSF